MPLRANFPLQTEEMLESALGVPVQTVNTAVPGYASQNARQLFEAEVSRFDADHLVVYLGWNDLGQYGPEGLPYKRLERGYRVSPLQRALSNVYSIRFLYAFQRYMSRSEPSFYGPLSAEEVALYDAYEPHHFAENLRAILTLAKRRYPHVYVGSIATITSDDPNEHELATAHYPTGMGKNMKKLHVLVTKYDFVVRELARELGVELLDFHGLFATPEARRHFTDSCHMNTEGARRMARMVSDAIARQERARPSLPRTGTAQAAQAH
jgi:lysophospholipase L1-like esterase